MLKNISSFHGIIQILEIDYSFKPYFFRSDNLNNLKNDNLIRKKRDRDNNNVNESEDEKEDYNSNFFLKDSINQKKKTDDNNFESSISPQRSSESNDNNNNNNLIKKNDINDNNNESLNKNNIINSNNNLNESKEKQKKKNNEINDNNNLNILNENEINTENNNNNFTKYEVIDDNYQNYYNNIYLLFFELYILKWERSLYVNELLSVDIYFFIEKISNFILLLKSNINFNSFNHFFIGSYKSNTLRTNNLQIDSVLSFENEIKNDNYSLIIKNFNSELKNNEFKIDLKLNERKEKYFEISRQILQLNLYLIPSQKTENILLHQNFMSQNLITIEKLISIKFIKSWRRDKKLFFFNPDIIEFIIVSFENTKIYELIPGFYQKIISDLNEKDYLQNYQKIEIKNLKESPFYNNLIIESQKALSNIINQQYLDFF